MKTEAEYLARRVEAHAAECADLDKDLLINEVFRRPPPIPPMRTPMQPGGFVRRQAD